MEGIRSDAYNDTIKVMARSPLILASFAVVAMATLAFQLIGTSVVAHFVVLFLYGAVFCAMGAFLVRPAVPQPTPATTLFPCEAGRRRVANNRNGSVTNGFAAGRDSPPFSLSPASPLNWVGETVEGSINWIRFGSSSGAESRAGPRGGRALPARTRSASAGGPVLSAAGNEGGGGGGAMSSLNVGGAHSANDASPTGFPRGFGRAAAEAALGALPALGAGIPQGARSRVWSRTLGSGGGSAVGGDDDESDGEDDIAGAGASVEGSSVANYDAGGGAGGDWMVGAGTVDGR